MTFVGKILVILIMAFSLVFLGISTVVFTTATNWSEKSKKQAETITKAQKKLSDATTSVKDADTKLETAKAEQKTAISQRETRIADLAEQVNKAEAEMNRARSELEVAQNNAKTALAEATARKGQIDTLNSTLQQAQTQANQFNAQNIDLKDQIRVLEREKSAAEQNAKDLRSFKTRTLGMLSKMGITEEKVNAMDPSTVPPAVEGKVMELNATRRSMEISIGSDDGLAAGQELYVFRVQPRAEYIGKVKIVSVYPDKAVAEIIGSTVNGKKVQENDIVSSTFFHSR
jgi:predicted  nucleic acid-binding Zn-ribbon protein